MKYHISYKLGTTSHISSSTHFSQTVDTINRNKQQMTTLFISKSD